MQRMGMRIMEQTLLGGRFLLNRCLGFAIFHGNCCVQEVNGVVVAIERLAQKGKQRHFCNLEKATCSQINVPFYSQEKYNFSWSLHAKNLLSGSLELINYNRFFPMYIHVFIYILYIDYLYNI